MPGGRNYRSFLGIYEFPWTDCGLPGGDASLTPRVRTMSAEAPTPHPEMPRRRSRTVKSNRTQILLFSILTLVLTTAVVWGGRTWLRNSETLVFAVGDTNGPEARFAAVWVQHAL